MSVLNIKEFLTHEELQQFNRRDNKKASVEVLKTWAWIVSAFAIVYFFPFWYVIIPALFIIGAKQLACAIIMHDAGHLSLFRKKTVNSWVGNLLGAWPIFHNVDQYAPYHRLHHINTGQEEDPDVFLTRGYPTTRWSFVRKILRDFLGITGIKAFTGLILMHLGFIEYNLGNKVQWTKPTSILKNARKNLTGPLFANLLLLASCYWVGMPQLFLLWIIAYLTTFQFCLRIRSIAEHSIVPDQKNPRKNSRTVFASPLETLLFAPLYVNYHSEHHLAMSVPSYRLPQLRSYLQKKHKTDYGLTEDGYLAVIRKAASKQH